ncbi:MAG TPA: Flp family type IVb pilin [Rhizomicrobium sp.]|nr:Flp family type IVb pilin [Rhizomicrobium sp.]
MNIFQKSSGCMISFIGDESGLSAVEYGLLAAGIAIGLWTLISGIGTDIHTIFENVKGDLDTAKSA